MSDRGGDDSDDDAGATPQAAVPRDGTEESWLRERDEPSIGEASRARGAVLSALFPEDARVLDGRYELGSMIGSGGLGRVYKARDTKLGRHVAVKFLKGAAQDPEMAKALEAEARVLARLQHPNIVAVHDVGRTDTELYLTMELIDGVSLETWLGEQRSWQAVVDIMWQAAVGLAAAHEAGVVHRDFKPANVMVDRTGRVRVVDFGLAREVAWPADSRASWDDATLHTKAAGTPPYMAPEQFDGEVSAASDQFAFCTTLYEGLSGERPWKARDRGVSTQRTEKRLQDALGKAKVPRWLQAVVTRGLQTAPERRHSSVGALAEGLGLPRRSRVIRTTLAAVASVGVVATIVLLAQPVDPCAAEGEQHAERLRETSAALSLSGTAFKTRFDTFLDELGDLERATCRALHDGALNDLAVHARKRCLDRVVDGITFTETVLESASGDGLLGSVLAPRLSFARCVDDSTFLEQQSETGFQPELEDTILRLVVEGAVLGSAGREEEALERYRETYREYSSEEGVSYAKARLALSYAAALGHRGKFEAAGDILQARLLEVSDEPSLLLVSAELRAMLAMFLSLQPERAKEAARLARVARAGLGDGLNHEYSKSLAWLAEARAAALSGEQESSTSALNNLTSVVEGHARRRASEGSDAAAYWPGFERSQLEFKVAAAGVLRVAGRRDDAVRAYEEVLPELRALDGLERPLAATLNNLGEARSEFDASEATAILVEEAADLKRRLGDPVGSARSWMTAGSVHLRGGRPAAGATAYETALAVLPTSATEDRFELLYNLGVAQMGASEHGRARATFESALRLVPDLADTSASLNFSVLVALAETELELQQRGKARTVFERALEIEEPSFRASDRAELHLVGCDLESADRSLRSVYGRRALRVAAAAGLDELALLAQACVSAAED